jgi:hypothetical protein
MINSYLACSAKKRAPLLCAWNDFFENGPLRQNCRRPFALLDRLLQKP